MYRHNQLLVWPCSIRSVLLLKETHLSTVVSDHTAAGWLAGRPVTKKENEDLSGKSRIYKEPVEYPIHFSSNLDFDSDQQRESTLSKAVVHHYHNPQVCAATKTKPASGASRDCFINTLCLQRQIRPLDFYQTSHNLHNIFSRNMQHFIRHFSLSTCVPPILKPRNRNQLPSLFIQQSRAGHQVAPHLANTGKDCLSSVNENRCRQKLESNLSLYQLGKGRKGAKEGPGNQPARWASVLVSLCSVEGEPAFLFTLRSSTLKGRHKGDVSFAGGKSDPSDGDVVTTALREAQEELGIKVAAEQVWGVMKPLRDMSGMMIAPVLANLGPVEELTFKPNPGEVEEIFTVSLAHLCSPQNRGYTHFRTGDKYGYTLPVFRNGKHRVWGLTAVALDHTLKLIVS